MRTTIIIVCILLLGSGCVFSSKDTGSEVLDTSNGSSDNTDAGPPPGEGEACGSGSSSGCASPFVCSQGICITPNSQQDGETCSFNVDCADGLICVWASEPYVCSLPLTSGKSCGHDTDCADGLTCEGFINPKCACPQCPAGSSCGANGCVTVDSVGEGEACAHNENCAGELICLWAETPYSCQPPAQLDEACGHPTDCAEGLKCSDELAVCKTQCSQNADCAEGELCSGSPVIVEPTGACYTVSPAGGPCASAQFCESGLACIGKVCASPLAAGASCQHSDECSADHWCGTESTCVPDITVGNVCVPTRKFNGSCTSGSVCLLECTDFLQTNDGICTAVVASGEACSRCEQFPVPPTVELGVPLTVRECDTGLVCDTSSQCASLDQL